MTNCNDILCIKTLNTSNPIYTYYCWDFLKVTSLCQQVPSNDCIHEWFIIKTYLFLHGTIEVLVSESFDHSLNWFIQTQNYTRIENTVNLLLVLNCCVLNCYLGFSLILLKGSLDATCSLQVVWRLWTEMCVGSVCTQPPYMINGDSFLIALNHFPFLISSHSQMPVPPTFVDWH